MKSGQLHQRLKEFHSTYGPVVRIAPDELSYADERAWHDIYSKRTGCQPFLRNETWFRNENRDEPHSVFSYREEVHARLRKAFAPAFLDTNLQKQAPINEGYVDFFVAQMRKLAGASVDMTQWFNYFSFDVAGDMSFGESFGCLEGEESPPLG